MPRAYATLLGLIMLCATPQTFAMGSAPPTPQKSVDLSHQIAGVWALEASVKQGFRRPLPAGLELTLDDTTMSWSLRSQHRPRRAMTGTWRLSDRQLTLVFSAATTAPVILVVSVSPEGQLHLERNHEIIIGSRL